MAESIENDVGLDGVYASGFKGLQYEVFGERRYPRRLEQGKEVSL